jgi:thiamine transport system permease protein
MPTVVVAGCVHGADRAQRCAQRLAAAAAGDLDAPPFQLEQTIWLILIVHVFYNVAIIIRTVGGFWSNLSPHLNEAAACWARRPGRSGAPSRCRCCCPACWPPACSSFSFAFTSFGVILILGGLRFATIEVEIYRQAVSYFNLPLAAFLSIVQLPADLSVMVVYTRLQARLSRTLRQRRRHAQPASRQLATVGCW